MGLIANFLKGGDALKGLEIAFAVSRPRKGLIVISFALLIISAFQGIKHRAAARIVQRYYIFIPVAQLSYKKTLVLAINLYVCASPFVSFKIGNRQVD